MSTKELKQIYSKVRFRKTTDEMSMLVYLIMFTGLKVSDLLGWFNLNLVKRRNFLKSFNILEDYESAQILFTKKHKTYLLQWKKACKMWIGKENATFEWLRKCCKNAKLKKLLWNDSNNIFFYIDE